MVTWKTDDNYACTLISTFLGILTRVRLAEPSCLEMSRFQRGRRQGLYRNPDLDFFGPLLSYKLSNRLLIMQCMLHE